MEPFKILVAEDDRNIRSGLVDALELEGYVMEEAADGAGALRKFTAFRPDLVLLDVMMPNLNGYEVCRRIRRSDAATPIIMLTAKGEEIDKVLGLELGADDYVTKPFGLRELSARIAAQLRRRRVETAAPPPSDEFAFGPWRVDVKKLSAETAGAAVELTMREIELLRLFAAHPGEVLDRSFIMREIWGNALTSSRTLDQHLVALRRKIEPEHLPRLIETVYGVGYRFRPE
ncbi:MAG TPA: response regulator transcription factor [Victivallis vadensis]|uniref:response regulator transcription factor n=1 Tax=uncultured Victivallis sp. TaxID=354118 RepID=UPI001D3D4689|nr:response regulator transcription factor [uncultured Victivallis sp.]HJH03006.1 response regulator transcription factor [Victivallis vadensis]